MEFLPFPKIATGAGGAKASTAGLWVAQEKIHGAQLVIGVEGGQAFFGKRKAWLADGDAFFGWQLLRRELAAEAFAMRDALRLASSSSAAKVSSWAPSPSRAPSG